MIQGGDPQGTGAGNGPRTLQAEFNERKHERGVLSMARGEDPNSASCQFFVMHATTPGLDNIYTAFGRLIAGYEALDAIANSPGVPIPRVGGVRPNEPQKLIKATVIMAATPK
jgi:peptidyl-prolyl cis-trans isomerase B (cyclophilin B)